MRKEKTNKYQAVINVFDSSNTFDFFSLAGTFSEVTEGWVLVLV